MALFKIPFNRANRNYSAQATLDGINYAFRIRYNRRMDSWVMDIKDQVYGILIIGGVDLLGQHKHKDVPQGEMRVLDVEGLGRDPALDNFGDSVIISYESV